MVRTEGVMDDALRARFSRFVRARGCDVSEGRLADILCEARAEYLRHEDPIYACAAEPCRRKLGVDVGGLPVVPTGCQGLCKQAPVAALRIGDHLQMFGQVTTSDDWRDVLAFAANARAAGSMLVPSEGTERFWCDPAHDHEDAQSSGALHALSFLVGHFQGEGRFAAGGVAFRKEVLGTYEAGGRFISLRMVARYPIPEGGCDVHRALVVLGAEARTGRIVGRAYTDGGSLRDYAVETEDGACSFDDVPPDHVDWKRVRKTLLPTAAGYDERLDVDGGDGFSEYSAVCMRRRSRHVACSGVPA
jgi:hypothetical protein